MRPREFDEVKVLDRALAVFWRRGYEGTSIADLVEATGVQRQSLYNAFTDKRGLFRAALDHYLARVRESLAPLNREGAGLAELRGYMEGVLQLQQQGGFGACLLVKTAFGPEIADAEIRAAVEAGAGAVRAAFARLLERAVGRGDLPSTISPEACAAFLYTVLNGLSALARTGARDQVVATLSHTFETFPSKPARRANKRRRP